MLPKPKSRHSSNFWFGPPEAAPAPETAPEISSSPGVDGAVALLPSDAPKRPRKIEDAVPRAKE